MLSVEEHADHMGKEIIMKTHKLSALILCTALILSFTGCGTKETSADVPVTEAATESSSSAAADNSDDKFVSAYPAFLVTSQSLHDGKWDEATAFDGKNVSPELSWEPVEGASSYVIYMIDMDTAYIIHWKSSDIKETSLPEGWAPSSDYVGPRPSSGITHKYIVYVFALKNPVEKVKGSIRVVSPKAPEFMEALNTDVNGNTGNIIAVGRVSGYYTAK